tara:strand:- start:97 stop:561 length:465 start_codon:yes stop_codon:yes gene_type:complete
MIRPAKYIDNLRLTALIMDMHEESSYAERATVDTQRFKKMCITAISQHGNRSCLFVAQKDGMVEGFIMGCVDRIYGISKEYYATDLFFYVSDKANPKDAMGLLKNFMDWAENADNVIEIRLGISGVIGGWERLQKVYERFGLIQDGVMMKKEIT